MVGLSQAQALAALNLASLGSSVNLVPTLAPPPGTVMNQSPLAGAHVPAGSVVTLSVSKLPFGPSNVKVPNLFGLTQAQATLALSAKGLSGNFQHVGTNVYLPGKVFSQSPSAMMWAPAGSSVVVKIADPLPPGSMGTVPNVIGKTPLAAKTLIEAAGFVSSGSAVPNLSPHNQAYWQSKPPFSSAPLGSVISWRWNP